jgi:hypothetical protein
MTLGSPEGHAQSVEQAEKAYQDGRWAEAASAYAAIVAEDPEQGRAWYRLAVASRHTGELEDAEAALSQAAAAGVPPGFIAVERARLALAAGDRGAATMVLEQAVASGFSQVSILETDPELESLRSQPAFTAVLEQARRNARPCDYDARFREFDFWIGEWTVRTPGNVPAGENGITREEQGCLLLERWRGVGGGTGTSMNYFDPMAGQWVQNWVGSGVVIDIRGGLEAGAMRLTGRVHYLANGETWPFRGTWTPLPDGRVRQFFEESRDDGATWVPWFDGYYTRKEPAPAAQ